MRNLVIRHDVHARKPSGHQALRWRLALLRQMGFRIVPHNAINCEHWFKAMALEEVLPKLALAMAVSGPA